MTVGVVCEAESERHTASALCLATDLVSVAGRLVVAENGPQKAAISLASIYAQVGAATPRLAVNLVSSNAVPAPPAETLEMTKPQVATPPAQFIILTHNEHGNIDAASVFDAAPVDAWKLAEKLAVFTRSTKCHLCSIKAGKNGAVEFTQMKKAGKK